MSKLLKTKEKDLFTSQQELNKNNDNIHLLQCNVNNLANVINKTKEDITIINTNYIKETTKLNQLNANNQQSNLVIKDEDIDFNVPLPIKSNRLTNLNNLQL